MPEVKKSVSNCPVSQHLYFVSEYKDPCFIINNPPPPKLMYWHFQNKGDT